MKEWEKAQAGYLYDANYEPPRKIRINIRSGNKISGLINRYRWNKFQTNMELTDCKWLEHNGQKADKDLTCDVLFMTEYEKMHNGMIYDCLTEELR